MTHTPYTLAREYLNGFRFYSRRHRNPFTRLRDLHLLGFAVERMRAEIVWTLRDDGATWVEVGEALGITASRARHLYGDVDSKPRTTRD